MQTKRENAREKRQLDRLTSLENTVISTMKQMVKFLDNKTTKTEVINQLKEIGTPDVDKVVKALEKLDSDVLAGKLDLTPLKEGISALEQQLKKLPTEYPKIPKAPDEITVKNQLDLAPVLKALKALKLDPTINVKSSDVHVDAPDLTPLLDALVDVTKAIKTKEIPATDLKKVEKQLEESNKHLKKLVDKPVGGSGGGGGNGTPYIDSTGRPVNVAPPDPTHSYSLVQFDDTSSASYEYYSYMDRDSAWYVKRLTTATNLFEFTAPASTDYTTGWTNRASLTYVSKGAAF